MSASTKLAMFIIDSNKSWLLLIINSSLIFICFLPYFGEVGQEKVKNNGSIINAKDKTNTQ